LYVKYATQGVVVAEDVFVDVLDVVIVDNMKIVEIVLPQ
jgi:hypothetical protein